MVKIKSTGNTNFDEVIPYQIRPVLSYHHNRLSSILLITYGTQVKNIEKLVDEGYFLLKSRKCYHSFFGKLWLDIVDGLFNVSDDFYGCSGGIFETGNHYISLV
jgi:hypothetical protein